MEVGPGLAITPAFSFSRHHNERRQALDVAMHSVEQTADPQTEAAIRIVAWVSQGALKPTSNDFAMLRLVLLSLLPQIGGILLMVGRLRA